MRILVDTHCWLWMIGEPDRFSDPTRDLLRNTDNELLMSAATAWEIAIKYAIGRLELPGEPAEVVSEWIVRSGVSPLPILHSHALRVASLPPHHSDPFDRLLVAQAQLEGVPILTADRAFEDYDVEVLAV
ncbi:MAG: type II toxin-antitoxin system VapC family toxin [Gemmatimonadota bacterium]